MKYSERVGNLLKPYIQITTQKYLDELFRNFCFIEIEHDRFEYDGTYDETTRSKTVFEYDEDTQQTTGYILTFDEHVENIFLSENKKSKYIVDEFYDSISKEEVESAKIFYNYLYNSIDKISQSIDSDILNKYPFIKDCILGIRKRAKYRHQKIFGAIKIDNSQISLHIHHKYLDRVGSINKILDSDAFKELYTELGGYQKMGGYITCDRIDRFKKIFKNEVILYPVIWNKNINGLTSFIEKLIEAKIISTSDFTSNNQGLWQTVAKCFIDKDKKEIAISKFNTRNSSDNTLKEIINNFIKNLNQEFKVNN